MKKFALLAFVVALSGCHGPVDRLTGGRVDEASANVPDCARVAPVNVAATDSEIVAAYTFDQSHWFNETVQFYDARTLPIIQQIYDGQRAYPKTAGGLVCVGDEAAFRRAVTASVHEGVLSITL